MFDTGLNVFRFRKDMIEPRTLLTKGIVKLGVGFITTNPFPILCGGIDIGMYLSKKIDKKYELNVNLNYYPSYS